MSLSSNLLLIRQLTDTTQAQFGEAFGATKAMIVSYESGKANPSSLMVNRICERLAIDKHDLLTKVIKEKDINVEKLELLTKEIKKASPSPKAAKNTQRKPQFGIIEGETEKDYLKQLSQERERVIQEKEARRQDAEARLMKADEFSSRLLSILEERLLNIHNDQQIALAYQKAWVELHADEVAKGNPKEARAVMAKMNKLIASKLQVIEPADNSSIQHS